MMNKTLAYLFLICGILCCQSFFAQEQFLEEKKETFQVRGSVIERETYKPISKVNVLVNGGRYTTTNALGEFKIEVSKGDELIIKHSDFETVYYTIQSNERIKVEVIPNPANKGYLQKLSKKANNDFKTLIDSAETYLKKDAQKSIQFVTEALVVSKSAKENAEVYEVLGNIYFEWDQYDLAITNYRISLQNEVSSDVQLQLAKSFELNDNYQESIQQYNTIDKRKLSNWQLIVLYEGLGDVHVKTKDYSEAINFYNQGLVVANKHLITPKITNLNSKIAQAYDASGEQQKAENFFENSLSLAEKENKKRAAIEKVRVADFQNKNREYDKEIDLRKEAIEEINDIETDSIFENEDAITPQKQNYKIGSAYALQKDFGNAINYLEKSIEEADDREDLLVQKDATRKLSEVYRDAGNLDKAMATAGTYERLVDELYVRKEQEISQAARFSKDLAEKQSRIMSLESDRALSETKYELTTQSNKLQKVIIYSLVGGVFLLLVTAYFMFRNIKQQRLNNNLLALKSLRSQMNPHFIFNALNSVNSFIASNDERTANKYLTDFSLLMRAVLENSEEDFIPLDKEIELIRLYTNLEHFRFKDKFDYSITVDEGIKTEEFVIPPMLLQPYIENAVWHGLRYKKEHGHLNITFTKTGDSLIEITIEDNGIGRERSEALKTQNQQKQNSKGMGNIKRRVAILNQMYKDKVDVFVDDLQEDEDAGTKVVVTLKKD